MRKNSLWTVKFLSLFISLSAAAFSCKSDHPSVKYNYELKPTAESIVFHLDSLTPVNTSRIQLFQDSTGDAAIAILNRPVRSIDIYEFKTFKMSRRIRIEKTGPSGISKPGGFFIIKFDSILVVDHGLFALNLINQHATVLKKWPATTYAESIMPYLTTSQSGAIVGRDFLFTGLYEGDPYHDRTEFFKKARFSGKISLDSPGLKFLDDQYPEVYRKINASSHFNDVQFLKKGDSTFFNFPLDENIYLKASGNAAKAILCKSRYAGSFKGMTQGDNSASSEVANYVSNICYRWIFFNKKKHLYYRLVELPVDDYDPGQTTRIRRNYSIITLDENLKIIAENILPSGNFLPTSSVFIKDGDLYIKMNVNSEEILQFAKFELKQTNDE